jgi:hypothetical protein
MSFAEDDLARLEAAEEIEIETQAPGSAARRTVIWVVVDDGEVFVRTYKGPKSRWYRAALAGFDRTDERRLPPQVRH